MSKGGGPDSYSGERAELPGTGKENGAPKYQENTQSEMATSHLPGSQSSDVSAPRSSMNKSPVEVKVYDDRQQLVFDKYSTSTSSVQRPKTMMRPCGYHLDSRTPVYNSATEYLNGSFFDYYGYGNPRAFSHHYAENIKGYHSYRVHPYPPSYYPYAVMPTGTNVRVQPTVKHTSSRIKPLRSPASSASSQKCSPLTPSPLSPSFLSPTNSVAWSPANDWDRMPKVTPPPAVGEWNRPSKATPPSPPVCDWDRVSKATPSPVVNSSPVTSLSSLISPISSTNGYSESHWAPYHHGHQAYCACKQPSTNHYSSQHANPITGYPPSCGQRSPRQSKHQEDYARKLYSLRHALKSDVFMGYGKNTERYELYADDRPVSPLKLLEIDRSLDWSNDIVVAMLETDEVMPHEDDEQIFNSIKVMSRVLTH